jgi:hypothetical protein
MNPMYVTPYEPKYKDQVIEIARRIHEKSVYADMPLEEDRLVAQLDAYGRNPDTYFRLAVRGDEVYGGFLGTVGWTFFCREKLARDMGWWVKPEKRGSVAAISLLRDFEAWARAKGARKAMIGQTGVIDIIKTTELFKHCGYKICGFNTVKDLQ